MLGIVADDRDSRGRGRLDELEAHARRDGDEELRRAELGGYLRDHVLDVLRL